MRSVQRRLVVFLVLATAVGIGVPDAGASPPPETFTETEQKVEETFVDVFPTCEGGESYEITTVTNRVVHGTVFDDGREHFTFTDTGKFEATPVAIRRFPMPAGASRSGAASTRMARP